MERLGAGAAGGGRPASPQDFTLHSEPIRDFAGGSTEYGKQKRNYVF